MTKFNAGSVIKIAAKSKELPSETFSNVITELNKQQFLFDGVIVTENKQGQRRMVLGVTNDDNEIDFDQPIVTFRLSNKLTLQASTPTAIFNELYQNYPVYFGSSKIKASEQELEDGAEEFRTVNWLTVAPANEYATPKAGKIDVAALLKGAIAGLPA